MTSAVLLAQSASEFVREAVPQSLVPAFVAITRLGNVGLFMLVFALDYWFGDHERGGHAIGVLIAGMGLITALKYYFAVPRPPDSVTVIPITGYSFPSGHAMGSTIAYGVLARDSEFWTARVRYATAAVLVAFVSLSRVVLGVHFVRDVVAGVVFGVAFLLVAFSLTDRVPRRAFALALVVALLAVVVSGASRDGVVVLGVAVGAAAVWEVVGPFGRIERRRSQLTLLGLGVPVLGGLAYLAIRYPVSRTIAFGLSILLAAGIVGAPGLVDRLDSSA